RASCSPGEHRARIPFPKRQCAKVRAGKPTAPLHFHFTSERSERKRPGRRNARAFVRGVRKDRLSRHARRRFRSEARRGRLYWSSAARLRRHTGRAHRLRPARRHSQVFSLSRECQASQLLVPINADQVAEVDLFGRQQVRQRVHYVPLKRPLQVPRPVPLVRPFLQQEIPCRRRHPKQKLPPRRLQYPLLHLPQLDLQYLFQLRPLQRMEHHHLVQPVHELRTELPPRRFHRRPFHLLVQPALRLVLRLDKSHPPRHQFRDLPAPQIRRHENHRLRQVHPPVISQRQRRFVQHPQKQLPQRIARLLNLVEQQKAQLQLVRMRSRQRFLRDQRMRLPVPQIPRRRADQLRNLMRMLKLRAIHLDHRPRVPKQNLRRRFHDPRLPRTRRPQKQQVPHRTPRRVQPRAEHLVQIHQRLHPFFLPHDLRTQGRLEIASSRAADGGIELLPCRRSHDSFLPRVQPPRRSRVSLPR